MELTVAICTYNPNILYLQEVIRSLQNQTFPYDQWELLIIDNNSNNGFTSDLDLSWHPNHRIILESVQGLTHARMRSAREASTDLLVCVDDDNVLENHYLEIAQKIMRLNPILGAIGGKAIPVWEMEPPHWFYKLGIGLGCRDLGVQSMVSSFKGTLPNTYPVYAPIGTGMVIRKTAYLKYVKEIGDDPIRKSLGRSGLSLASGEDNDMMLTLIKNGWEIGYFPELKLSHLMPTSRISKGYLAQLAQASNKSWIQVLEIHKMNPWTKIHPWTLPLRKVRAYFKQQAWKDPFHYIKWKSACGLFDGQASIYKNF